MKTNLRHAIYSHHIVIINTVVISLGHISPFLRFPSLYSFQYSIARKICCEFNIRARNIQPYLSEDGKTAIRNGTYLILTEHYTRDIRTLSLETQLLKFGSWSNLPYTENVNEDDRSECACLN